MAQSNHDEDASATATVPEAGEMAPDFTLPSSTGEAVHLAGLLGKQVVLYFYPNDDWTPVKIGV